MLIPRRSCRLFGGRRFDVVLNKPFAQSHVHASCNFVVPTSLEFNLLKRTSRRRFSMSCQSAVFRSPVQPPLESRSVSYENFLEALMKTTFLFRRDWKNQPRMVSLDHQLEFQIFSHTATFCLAIGLVFFANNRSMPSLFCKTRLNQKSRRTFFCSTDCVFGNYPGFSSVWGRFVVISTKTSQARINSRE